MSNFLSFGLLFLMPVAVGYVVYRVMTYDQKLWREDIERMKDDMF